MNVLLHVRAGIPGGPDGAVRIPAVGAGPEVGEEARVLIALRDSFAVRVMDVDDRALELGLADEISTSDELLATMAKDHDLYRVAWKVKQPLQKRLMANVDGVLEKVDSAGWTRRFESRLPR